MIQPTWGTAGRKKLVCIDSYDQGILKGRFYNEKLEGTPFDSLSQFLIKVEQELEADDEREAKSVPRTFVSTPPESHTDTVSAVGKGRKATFELQLLFRQHTSWQGVIDWREKGVEQSFRSVLELVFLMDSALRSA